MRKTKAFSIAGHKFCVTADTEEWQLMTNYEPFAVNDDSDSRNKVFALSIESGDSPSYLEELRQQEDGQTIVCGKISKEISVFEFLWNGISGGCLIAKDNYQEGHLIISGRYMKPSIDNALMIMYALATADKKTVLFHAAVVSHNGSGIMFLGPSGTGKSTHARLWLQYIEGAELVNDDNPIVRIWEDGVIDVFGSPWSGKTPCYRNVSYPLTGIIKLHQAPHNNIYRLSGIKAYMAIRQSISGTRWDRKIADGLHETENELIKTVPIWALDCLPDKEAVEMCCSAIIQSSQGKI